MKRLRHLPATPEDLRQRGWTRVDILLISGDAYVDHPSFPAALLGRWLESAGFRVGILARPDLSDPQALTQLGRPRLFAGVTAGALDSMVANYTAAKKRRRDDPYAPGGMAGGRPDRAVTAYGNALRRAFGKRVLVVAGGIEASLRRFAHYDYWADAVRRPLLMDCGADLIVHGMGEGPALELARTLAAWLADHPEVDAAAEAGRALPLAEMVETCRAIDGLVWRTAARNPVPEDAIELPSAEEVAADAKAHITAYMLQEQNRTKTLTQRAGGMRVVANPPWKTLDGPALDRVYDLAFTRRPHPMYGAKIIPALATVEHAVTAHRGCFGGCAFCAIGVHQGKTIGSRGEASILREINAIAKSPGFHGTISDIGGPTANMYGLSCGRKEPCERPSCLWPKRCPHLQTDQSRYRKLLARASKIEGVKHVFVQSGIRMDLALLDDGLIADLAFRHTSGHLKVAPEHVVPHVLKTMRKPPADDFDGFLARHRHLSKAAQRRQNIVPYLIAAHPGCRMEDMAELAVYLKRRNVKVEQCQVFTPTPGTAATVMYATGLDPASGKPVYVERDAVKKRLQKSLILYHLPENDADLRRALKVARRPDLADELLARQVSPSSRPPVPRRRRK